MDYKSLFNGNEMPILNIGWSWVLSWFLCTEYENEENVLVCLRIIIELHKQYRPAHSQEYICSIIF